VAGKQNLSYTEWALVARMCPMDCEVSHLTEEDYVEAVDERGLKCKRAAHHFVPGTMTAVEETWGWRFYHPGFKGGSKFVHALNCDTSPSYAGVSITRETPA
jgi:hypothetical protein